MDHRTLAQIGALVFLAVAAMAAAVHWASREELREIPTVHLVPSAPDPLRDGQRRCQRLGEAAARDSVCLKVWSDTRDRFLGRGPAEEGATGNGAGVDDTNGGR
ncbi:MAG: putative entry exclusion protein TrbK-alt [Amaricoccus sp.]|uniref:putative entry exclusion protein TrbK-alt n=1 Tax=Amaricoccus sp. TaxID=1872485 RepID=UPI0033162009